MGALDGKVAVVTGAGQGLGRSHALMLAREGASVVVNDVRGADEVVALIESEGGKAVANDASVSDWDASAALVRQAVETFGDLHVVVNNAGIIRDAMSFNMSESDFDAVVAVHLKGHFCVSRHAGVYWREQAKAGASAGRRLINTTSEAGLFGSAGQANYSPAKAGIVALTWVFAREYERYGVTANVIAPRARTPMTEHMPSFAPRDGESFDRFAPEHVSTVVVWLASDGAADISGQVFVATGGALHVMEDPPPIAASLTKDGPWTLADLEAGKATLFAARSPGVPPMTPPIK